MPTCIASERVRLGLNQDQMAERLSMTRQAYRRYEKDPLCTPYRYLEALTKEFGCSMDYLVGKTDDRLPKGADSRA